MYIGVFVLLAAAYYFMTPQERVRVRQAAGTFVRQAYETVQGGPPHTSFFISLRQRTSRAPITPSLIVLNIATFTLMALGSDSTGDANTLLAWGANSGPRTTNGEWHRLVTSMFVHAGMLQLLVNVAGLAAVGFITERLVGSATFAAAYLAAGVFAGIVSLAINPMAVSFGASGAIVGIYGLLLAFTIRSVFKRPEVEIPALILKRLGAAAGVFVFYNALSGSLPAAAELSAFAVALAHGVLLTRGVFDAKPRLQRVAGTAAATVVVVIGLAAPLRGIDDVRPEAESIVAIERRTAGAYDAEVERYKVRKSSENALVQMIDATILPDLRALAARLSSLDKVPAEQRQLIENAKAYVRLREESWRLRAEGLRQRLALRTRGGGERLHISSALALREAETKELAALEALQGVLAILASS